VYSEYYRDNLLNWARYKILLITLLVTKRKEIIGDHLKILKVFNGAVYTKIKWDDIVLLVNGRYDGVIPDIAIQVNSAKKIYKKLGWRRSW
jgi:hypothetical protein